MIKNWRRKPLTDCSVDSLISLNASLTGSGNQNFNAASCLARSEKSPISRVSWSRDLGRCRLASVSWLDFLLRKKVHIGDCRKIALKIIPTAPQ